MDLLTRRFSYEGSAGNHAATNASLEDIIPMGGIAPDIKVVDILDTESGILCYKY